MSQKSLKSKYGESATFKPVAVTKERKKSLDQALLNKILFIGEEVPEYFVTDPRPKFIILGNPQQLMDEVANKDEIIKLLEENLAKGATNTMSMAIKLIKEL